MFANHASGYMKQTCTQTHGNETMMALLSHHPSLWSEWRVPHERLLYFHLPPL